MPLRSKREMWLSVVVVAAIAAGCGDDPSAPPAGHLQPVVGCEAIDPSPCDVFDSACQTKLMDLASCMRGSSAQPLPPVSRMTESEYVQLLTDEIQADVPPPGLDQYEHALTLLHLVVAGAFKPASMAAMRASRVAGFYRSDMDDIVLIDRGMPAADADTNTVLLHELVHALQDRDQDLPTWYDARTDTYDATLASMSVVEGEARLHQERFAESVFGLDPRTVDLAKHFDGAIHLSETWVRMQPSPYLASYSAFPYEFGARLLLPRFVQDGPQAIADLFAAPPADTRTLLDPGNSAVPPAWSAPAAPTPSADWAFMQQTTLGAWAVELVLGQDGAFDDAALQARAWRGDRLWVYGDAAVPAAATAIVWRIAFADDATAGLVYARLATRYEVARAGAEVVIASADYITSLDWAFAVPVQNASGDERQLASDSGVGEWVSRFFKRGE